MTVAADTHVHLYPSYDVGALLDAAQRNLRRAAPEADAYALCLTDRSGQFAFRDLRDGAAKPAGWSSATTPDPNALLAHAADGRRLFIIAGRQLVSSERIEVLALGADLTVDDGAPAREMLARVRAGGAFPVLPWGMGKWIGARGKTVRALIEAAAPGDFAVADTALRPLLAPESPLLRVARSRGLRVLAGSDPLPRAGEEQIAGRYAVLVESDLEASRPAASLVRMLADSATPLRIVGRRCSPWQTLLRMR